MFEVGLDVPLAPAIGLRSADGGMASLCFRAAAALECDAGTEVEACRRDCVGTKAGLIGKALAKLSNEVWVPDVERKTGPEEGMLASLCALQ